MTEQSVRWGLVGCGWVARDYVAPALREAPSSSLVALCDPNTNSLARVAAATPGAATFADLEALLRNEVDAVYVATPNHLHRPVVEAAARAGKRGQTRFVRETNGAHARRRARDGRRLRP